MLVLSLIAGLGLGMVLGAGLALMVAIYLKNQGYGLQVEPLPATRDKVDALVDDVKDLKEAADHQEKRLDALAELVDEMVPRPTQDEAE